MLDKVWALGKVNDTLGKKIKADMDDPLGLDTKVQKANVILFQFRQNEQENWQFEGLSSVAYDSSQNQKFLFKVPKASRATSPFPTFRTDDLKTPAGLEKLLSKFLDKFKSSFLKSGIPSLQDIWKELEIITIQDNFPTNFLEYFDREQINLVSLKLNEKFIGECDIFQPLIQSFESRTFRHKEYRHKHSTLSVGKEQLCSMCLKQSEEVYGYSSPWSFYSCNEDAYIAGGFQKKHAWKNHPVCPDCTDLLLTGQKLIDKNLKRSFYSCPYLLIPSDTSGLSTEFPIQVKRLIQTATELSLAQKDESDQEHRKIMEEKILSNFAEENDQITLSMFFYEPNNSEFKIIFEIEDLLPSRCQELFSLKKTLSELSIYQDLKGLRKKGQLDDLHFNFGVVRHFFHSPKNNRPFLDICSKIFKGQSLNYLYSIDKIMVQVSNDFRNNKQIYSFRKGMLFLHFCHELSLFPAKPQESNPMNITAQPFFDTHSAFFRQNWQKSACLIGVLVQKLLNLPEQKTNSFRKRMNGLRIDGRILRRLYTEAIEKLEQYDKNYYQHLEEDIARCLLVSPNLDEQSINEISFFFTMGMKLQKDIYKLYQSNDSTGENQ